MPQPIRRLARATQLVKFYIQHQQARKKRLQHHQHTRQDGPCVLPPLDPLSELSSAVGNTDDTCQSDSVWSSSGSWLSETEDGDEVVSELAEVENDEYPKDDDGEIQFFDSDADADDEGSDDDEGFTKPSLRRGVQDAIAAMYACRYEAPRDGLPRGPAFMNHVLTTQKDLRPDLFRQSLRVSPLTFDKIVAKISGDPVFFNNSNNPQQPVEEQLAIALFRFGHNGNAASLQKVADWAGTGKGTVTLATHRVMTAVLRPEFMQEAVHFPTAEEKEAAKVWVEGHSCKAWRNGWCLVDGTLVPLYARPYWFGESYFDRKCNYSLNIQIVSLPNLRIIDFSYGHTGSTHDSTAWEETRTAQEHETLIEDGEWVWADSAYPISVWVVAPYKKPERDIAHNEIFNNYVSMVRIRSEHAIGFLKGRFYSLKDLRIQIKNEKSHKFATYWVASCIGLHAFAMQCEDEEDPDRDTTNEGIRDSFIDDGLSSPSSSDHSTPYAQRFSSRRLRGGKAHRERLKRRLFRAKGIDEQS